MPQPLFPLLSLSQDDATVKQLCRGAFIYPASFSLAGRQLLTQPPNTHLSFTYTHGLAAVKHASHDIIQSEKLWALFS